MLLIGYGRRVRGGDGANHICGIADSPVPPHPDPLPASGARERDAPSQDFKCGIRTATGITQRL